MTVGARARLAIGIAGVLAAAVAPGLSIAQRLAIAALLLGVFLPYAVTAARVDMRAYRAAVRLAGVATDLVVVFGFALVFPASRTISLFGYLLVVAFATLLGGAFQGVAVAGLTVPLVVVAELAGPVETSHDTFTLTMYYVVMLVLVAVVAGATAERRRASDFLSRLQRALAGVAPDPDLDRTLASIATAARHAVEAKFVSVLVRGADGVVQGALEGDHAPDPKERSSEIIERILAEPERSPSGLAFLTGEPVVVADVAMDERFSDWTEEAARQGFTSTIAVPLKGDGGVIGVLASYLHSPRQVTPETVRLLTAYGGHAALVVQRAMAWEHERAAAHRLEEADRMKSDLVATVSHELRTPLTSVRGFAETLVRHWDRFDDDDRLSMLERVLDNSIELARLIDQVLDYSSLEAGVVTVDLRDVALDELVSEWAGAHGDLVPEHQFVVELDAPARVVADREAVDHILTNLVSNAVKYSPAGTTVWLRAVQRDGHAVVSVVDEGPGIDPEDHERIFRQFERGRQAAGVPGSGIGLAVVRRYVELLDGTVWVESEPGSGSTFSFTLPVVTADHRTSAAIGAAGQPAGSASDQSDER